MYSAAAQRFSHSSPIIGGGDLHPVKDVHFAPGQGSVRTSRELGASHMDTDGTNRGRNGDLAFVFSLSVRKKAAFCTRGFNHLWRNVVDVLACI